MNLKQAFEVIGRDIKKLMSKFSDYIPNSDKSDATSSTSSITVATSKAVKDVYDLAADAKKQGLPVGSIIGIPRGISKEGYLKCNGLRFSSSTYPDLYQFLGKNVTPNLNRSDVGMTAFFAVDQIPDGWIEFDVIRTTVTQQSHPDLYQHLVTKYGSISNVPLADDRFIRNAGSGLNVGQTQDDAIRNITGELDLTMLGNRNQFLEVGDDYNEQIFKGAFKPQPSGWSYWTAEANGGTNMPRGFKFDASTVVPTAGENRPKSLVLKLCIKARNTFDDIQFWIKAYGVVENAGSMNAETLAQDIQQVSVQTQQNDIKTQQVEGALNQHKEQANQRLQLLENKVNNDKSRVAWVGNATQHSTNLIQLSEAILNRTLVFYLQTSQSHSLSQNVNVHVASLYVDGGIMDAVGRKYCHGGLYVGG